MTKRRARQAARDSGEPEQFGGPPTVISVEAGLGYGSMLVDRSPGVGGTNPVRAEELGLSPELTARLAAWLARWEPHLDWGVTIHLDEEMPDWMVEEGQELGRQRSTLAYAVQHELGPDVEVLLDGQPVHGRHGP